MPVFQWEIDLVNMMFSYHEATWLLNFMELVSDFSRTGYLVLAAVVITIYRRGFKWTSLKLTVIAISVALADALARYVAKAVIQRPRPTHLYLECFSSDCWGFVSNHAANTAAAATILIAYDKKNAVWAAPIALLVGFSRIFLGKHYPLDVAGGQVLGVCIGVFVIFGVKKFNIVQAGSADKGHKE